MTAMLISAAVLRASDAPYTIEQAKLGDPGPGEVLVKIAGAGLCHTDLLGRTDLVGKPVVLGHEVPRRLYLPSRPRSLLLKARDRDWPLRCCEKRGPFGGRMLRESDAKCLRRHPDEPMRISR